MSCSSSGPGIAISDAPGGIVPFEDVGSVQFGEHQPISFEEARRRTWLRQRELEALKEMNEERERERERERGRRGQAWEGRRESAAPPPYPVDNTIPTEEAIVGGMARPGGLPFGRSKYERG